MIKNLLIKSLYISTYTILILHFSLSYANAQIFDSEQNPPGVKWSQINTTNFQVIYPAELETEAQRMANTLEAIISSVSKTLNKKPRKISIILQNQSVVANGFVQLAPRRAEFFTTPPQEFDYQDWLNSLAVHELRHVVQFEKLSGTLKAPLFEELALTIFGITLPPWFFEGDAVGIETALSNAGRGRLPSWELTFRTNTLSGRSYSYSKNYFGSVKDRTPGYYQLGYFMTSKLRRDYGSYIIDSIMTRISRKPFRPYSLSNSIKKITGLNSRTLHDSTLAELSSLWQEQTKKLAPLNYMTINKRKNQTPADYLLPASISPTEIIVLKQSKAHTPAFVKIDAEGNEHTILKIGFQTESHFNYSLGKLVWDEFRYDTRFQKRSYNVINLYDMETRQYKQLTHKSRLFSPALSPDGKNIAAVKISLDNTCTIVELDAESARVIRTFPNPANYILQTPNYNKQGNRLICVAISKEGAALLEIDIIKGTIQIILPFQQQQLSRPAYAGEQIVFRAHYNGLDNIYSLSPGSSITELTSAAYGAENPYYDQLSKKLLFNNYQVNGYDVSFIPYREGAGTPLTEVQDTFIDYAAPLVEQEAGFNVFDSIPALKYPSMPYQEFKNLFYFHSLSPIAENNDLNDDLNIGLKLKSNNQLNTLDFYAGYQFNYGLKRSEYLAGFTYKRFYPILDVRYINRAQLSYTKQTSGGVTNLIPVNWRENFTELELSIPFLFNRLNKTYSLGLRSSSSYTSRYDVQNRPSRFINNLKFPLKYQVYLNRNSQRSARDLAPRWGENITLSYNHLPFEKELHGYLFSLRSSFFMPGIFNNHSFQASYNYQESSGAYDLNIDIPKISGYNNLAPLSNLRNTLLLDYRLPLFYPDAEIGSLAYIKRIKGAFFADFENLRKGNTFKPRTYGLELSADMNLLRFYLPNFDLAAKLIFVNEKSKQNPILEIGFTYNY